jgi:hypothetical protein
MNPSNINEIFVEIILTNGSISQRIVVAYKQDVLDMVMNDILYYKGDKFANNIAEYLTHKFCITPEKIKDFKERMRR